MKPVNEQVYPQVIDRVWPQVRSQVEWQARLDARILAGLPSWPRTGLQVCYQVEEDLI